MGEISSKKSRSRLLAELSRGLRIGDSTFNADDNTVVVHEGYKFATGPEVLIGYQPGNNFYDSEHAAIQILDGRYNFGGIYHRNPGADSDFARSVPAGGSLSYNYGKTNRTVLIDANLYVDSDSLFYAGQQAFWTHVLDSERYSGTVAGGTSRNNHTVSDSWSGTMRGIGGHDMEYTYTLRHGRNFDSDLHLLLVDSLLRKSRTYYADEGRNSSTDRGRRAAPGEYHYNRPLQRIAKEISIKDLYDVETVKQPRVGDYLIWNGANYEPETPRFVRNTIRKESGEIPAFSPKVSFSRDIGEASHSMLFLNGHLLARDSETIVRDAQWYGDSDVSPYDSDSQIDF